MNAPPHAPALLRAPLVFGTILACWLAAAAPAAERPNIVWIFVEDQNGWYGCYDLGSDPHETRNLAEEPEFAAELRRHRDLLDAWIEETDDKGRYPESIDSLRGVLERWDDHAVNPEFKAARTARQSP